VKEIVAQLGFGECGRVAGKMRVDQPHLAVIGVAGAIGVVAQGQQLGEAGHRLIGMLVIDRIDILAACGPIVLRVGVGVARGGMIFVFHTPATY